MDRLFTQMDRKARRQIKTRMSAAVALMVGLPCSILAQDSLLVDSLPTYPTLRVRSFVEADLVDSLWSDSVWVWNGTCEGPVRSFRFEFPDSTYCALEAPCTRAATPPADLNTPLSSASNPSLVEPWTAAVDIALVDLEGIPRKPLASSCFPPAASAAFDAVLSAMEQAVFEAEKCAILERASEAHCLTRNQMHEALDRIANEDRKLETFEQITHSDIEWTEAELRELFQLNFILERALKRFTKR